MRRAARCLGSGVLDDGGRQGTTKAGEAGLIGVEGDIGDGAGAGVQARDCGSGDGDSRGVGGR